MSQIVIFKKKYHVKRLKLQFIIIFHFRELKITVPEAGFPEYWNLVHILLEVQVSSYPVYWYFVHIL